MKLFRAYISFASLIVFVLLFQSSAMAETKMFGALRGGLALGTSYADSQYTTTGAGGNFGASFGIQSSEFFRWDLAELNYMSAYQTSRTLGWFDNSALSLGTSMRFGYFAPTTKFHPYVTAGIAANRFQVQQYESLKSEWAFGWNVGAGVEYALSDEIGLGLRYRYRSSVLTQVFCPPSGAGCGKYNSKVNFQTVSLEVVFF